MTRSAKDVDSALSLKTNMSLRKSRTFHSPTSASSSDDDFVPPPIRRSQTNLDDVIDAHRRRVALIVDDINKSLTISEPSTSTPKRSKKFRDNSLPVPPSFLDLPPVVDPAMAKETEPERRQLRPRNRRPSRNHASDSGLGTSVASTKEEKSAAPTTTSKKASAITRSAASSTMERTAGLNQRAVNRIHEHTLRPLLAKPSLKDFRPIVLDIPRRISEKEIICLRDLEKTLIFMAPVSQLSTDIGVWGVTYRSLRLKERTKTAALYLDFCLTSIRYIKATAGLLNEREQTRPRDRPYTNLYFMDLEEQIRQYARQLADAKDKPRTSASSDDEEMDLDPYEPSSQIIYCIVANTKLSADEVRLYGGLAKNGRPAELVRVKRDGKAISIATGKPVDLDEEDDFKGSPRLKRSLSEQDEDDDIMRSMARRKKNASPEELAPKKCREPGCDKEFKRPCDLTKHEKTHSRPWKCPVKSCKYHDYGWPTEKERDRHHNDKHASSPATFECLFKPCPYKSKRESNCKQHMEKAHGWCYVRTKTSGRKAASKASPEDAVNNTPQLTTAPTPITNFTGVHTPPMEESTPPYMPFNSGPSLDFPQYLPHAQFINTYGDHPADIDLDDMQLDASPIVDTPSTGPFETYPSFDNSAIGSTFTFNDEDLYTGTVQLPTPDPSVFAKMGATTHAPYHQTYADDSACQTEGLAAPHLSPNGQGNAMLFTPKSLVDVDEGFEDFPSTGDLEHGDFQLYPATSKMNYSDSLFGEIPSAGLEGLGFSQQTQPMFQPMDWQPFSSPH